MTNDMRMLSAHALPVTRDGKLTLGKRGPATLLEAAVEYIRIASDAHGHDAQVHSHAETWV